MLLLRILAYFVVGVKFLLAAPFILYLSVVVVFGIGADGPIRSNGGAIRLTCLCLLVGVIAVAYPFSLVRCRGYANWIVVALSALPLGFYAAAAAACRINGTTTGSFGVDFAPVLVCSLGPVLAIVDMALSTKLPPRDE